MNGEPMSDRYSAVFRSAVKNGFAFMKDTGSLDDLYAKSIPLEGNAGFLLPVCELHFADDGLVADLSRWREENAFAFPTRFQVTVEGTRRWLRSQVLDLESRILFLVVDRFGRVVGHAGYANCLNDSGLMEIDNVVRGIRDQRPGIMSQAVRSLLDWAEEMFLPREIHLRVLQGNSRAIDFYRRLGFREDGLIPLRDTGKDGDVNLVALPEGDEGPADDYFVRMVYEPERPVDGTQMILTAGPSISARESSYALDAARYGWNARWNGYLERFEKRFSEYLGVEYALSTACCTGAMHIALLAMGIGRGDEVIVPEITWVATANAVAYTGAVPVFADVDPDTWCMDPADLESRITGRTKAVIPVHLYGHPAPMDRILDIARAHGLRVLEDAAPSIGAEFKGRKTGTFGDFAAFSFQGAKLAVTGEGGMLVTRDKGLFDKAHKIWDQGRVPGTFWIDEVGWKYKMSNIQAAIGLGQMERIDELVEAKRRIFSWYEEGLEGVRAVRLNREAPQARSIYWMTSICLEEDAGITRDELAVHLRKRSVDTRPVFPAISQYPIWPLAQKPQPVALRIGRQALNLPSGVRLRREQVDHVCASIKTILAERD